jgi:uncharacterized protein
MNDMNENQPSEKEKNNNYSKRGFGSMSKEERTKIARMGGHTVSNNREHMKEIGKKGGHTISQNREYMAEIGRRGGSRKQYEN